MPETTKLPYTTAVGRRKTASARVKVTPSEKTSVTVNGISAEEYFKTKERTSITGDAFRLDDVTGSYEVMAKVHGGGMSAQAEAVRHAISRALMKGQEDLRGPLKLQDS
jgi:small subunit ribosomal protein S9